MKNFLKMSKEAQAELEGFVRFISEFDFDFASGKFNVSSFTGTLFQCLAIDRRKQPPYVTEMQEILVNRIAASRLDGRHRVRDLWNERVVDWSPEMAEIYPTGYARLIDLSTLLAVGFEWIFEIGQLLPDRSTDRGNAYFFWCRPEWPLTNMFLKRFHEKFWNTLRDFDAKRSESDDYSFFEALHLATSSGLDYDEAVAQLEKRDSGFALAIERVDRALEAGFPFEAIVICESLISSCLHHVLLSLGQTNPPQSLARLIERFNRNEGKLHVYPEALIKRVDAWRRERNNAVHRFVARDLKELEKSQAQLDAEARVIAADGRTVCVELLEWFRNEAPFFLKVSFVERQPIVH